MWKLNEQKRSYNHTLDLIWCVSLAILNNRLFIIWIISFQKLVSHLWKKKCICCHLELKDWVYCFGAKSHLILSGQVMNCFFFRLDKFSKKMIICWLNAYNAITIFCASQIHTLKYSYTHSFNWISREKRRGRRKMYEKNWQMIYCGFSYVDEISL